jgi:hypothetical protein
MDAVVRSWLPRYTGTKAKLLPSVRDAPGERTHFKSKSRSLKIRRYLAGVHVRGMKRIHASERGELMYAPKA